MSEDEERDLYEKHIKPQKRLWPRIKRWFSPTRAIKTIHDVDYFDWDMVVKLFCIILLCLLISTIGGMIADIWFWFFPQAQTKGGEWGYFMPALMGVFA